jgi:anti-sigma-K factor RskA
LNIDEYISSGILEAYALGELSAAEQTAVEKNLVQYPVLCEELRLIEAVQEQLLLKVAMQPNASVKAKLFARIDVKKSETKVVTLHSFVWKYATAASLALAFLASFIAYDYYNRWRATENNLTTLLAQNQQMAQDYNTVNQRLDKIQSDMHVVGNPEFNRVVMRGTPNAPDAIAYVYWSAQTKEVFLSIQHLKQLSNNNQYQLWAIVDGKPVDAGVFDASTAGLLKMKEMTGAIKFAITVEPRGGREMPSLETMQVVGDVTG